VIIVDTVHAITVDLLIAPLNVCQTLGVANMHNSVICRI